MIEPHYTLTLDNIWYLTTPIYPASFAKTLLRRYNNGRLLFSSTLSRKLGWRKSLPHKRYISYLLSFNTYDKHTTNFLVYQYDFLHISKMMKYKMFQDNKKTCKFSIRLKSPICIRILHVFIKYKINLMDVLHQLNHENVITTHINLLMLFSPVTWLWKLNQGMYETAKVKTCINKLAILLTPVAKT